MRPAQIGLLIVTPLVIGMAILLRRQGALGTFGAAAASLAALAIAAVLFFSH